MTPKRNRGASALIFSPAGLAASGFMVVVGYFLWSTYATQITLVLPYLPYLLLLACPLLHALMHRGHGGHGHGELQRRDGSEKDR